MIPVISDHSVHTPKSLEQALRFLSERRDEGWRPLAGGTDVMVGVYRDHAKPNRWLNLSRLRPELAGIRREDHRIRVGALTTMTELRRSSMLGQACPLIGQAAASVGAAQIQNRATVGGNIINGSPAGDTLPVWLALDATVELASARCIREIPYGQLMTGYRRTLLEPDELLTAVSFTRRGQEHARQYFRKLAPRAAQGISKLVIAAIADVVEGYFRNLRLAFGGVGPKTLRATTAELYAEGKPASLALGVQTAELLVHDLSPIDDQRSTADYRLRVAKNLVREFLAGQLGELHHGSSGS